MMLAWTPLHQHALIEAGFPLRVPTPDDPRGSAFEFAEWLQSELAARSVDCGAPQDIDYGHQIVCKVDGYRLVVLLSVDDLMGDPAGFHLDIQLPGESMWQRWRRGRKPPVWWETARQWAATIDASLASQSHIHEVTWYPVAFPVVPQPSYRTSTSQTPSQLPPIRWYHRLALLHNRAFGWLTPIVVLTFAGALGALLHPALGIVAIVGVACGTLWFCLIGFGLGAQVFAAGLTIWWDRDKQVVRSRGETIWALILIVVGLLVSGYFLVLPFLIVREMLSG